MAELQCTCVPPEEELLVDSCFERGGETVRYKNVDEPVRLDAGNVTVRNYGGLRLQQLVR